MFIFTTLEQSEYGDIGSDGRDSIKWWGFNGGASLYRTLVIGSDRYILQVGREACSVIYVLVQCILSSMLTGSPLPDYNSSQIFDEDLNQETWETNLFFPPRDDH